MDFDEKAKIRLQHWISHNDHHQEEYKMFSDELENAGMVESARHVRKMIDFTLKSTECLRKAFDALDAG